MNNAHTYQLPKKIMGEIIDSHKNQEPIRKGCNTNGLCFCTGECQEIIGWRDKMDEKSIFDIIQKANNISEKSNTVKIAEPKNTCIHPSHNPPSHMVYSPGTYRHTCPGCGHIITFEVAGISW